MVERQPGRPSEIEVKGAALRIVENNYSMKQSPYQIEPSYVGTMFFLTGYVVPLQDSSERMRERDVLLLQKEQAAEGVNPDESFAAFVLRIAQHNQ